MGRTGTLTLELPRVRQVPRRGRQRTVRQRKTIGQRSRSSESDIVGSQLPLAGIVVRVVVPGRLMTCGPQRFVAGVTRLRRLGLQPVDLRSLVRVHAGLVNLWTN